MILARRPDWAQSSGTIHELGNRILAPAVYLPIGLAYSLDRVVYARSWETYFCSRHKPMAGKKKVKLR